MNRLIALNADSGNAVGRRHDIRQNQDNRYSSGSTNFDLRPCLETMVDIYRSQ